jgi:hypothetical protein
VTGQISLTVFKAGDVIRASEVNQNFQVLQKAIEASQLPKDCTPQQGIKWSGTTWLCAEAATPWLVSISVEGAVLEGGAVYTVGGGGGINGLHLKDDFSRFHVGFTLPLDYTPGKDIVLELTWGKQPSLTEPCNYQLRSNGISAYRVGQAPLFSGDTFASDTPRRTADGASANIPAPDSSKVQGLTVVLAGTINATPRYQPGDHLSYSFFRDGGNMNDTCAGASFVVFGMSAREKE